jgi:hydrogenase maturation factor
MEQDRFVRGAGRPLEAGKIAAGTFDGVIKPWLGKRRAEVLAGPAMGIDAGIVDLGAGRVMAITTDPFYVDPAFGLERAAWFAVHIVASDVATTALRPAYLTVDLNLPRSITDEELGVLWRAVSRTCEEVGMAVVAGHTARYDGCEYPMLGGATVIGVGSRDGYVLPSMAGPGDAVLLTKGAAIETTGVFGVTFRDRIEKACGPEIAAAAEDLFCEMSVVRDARIAAEVGVRERGVTAMHDATERGVFGGLVEIAEASDAGMIVDADAIPVRPESRAVCDLFGVDPFTTSSEGTLLLTCRPHATSAVIERLGAAGLHAGLIGEMTPRTEGIRVIERGRERELRAPWTDPFWPAFVRALTGRGA